LRELLSLLTLHCGICGSTLFRKCIRKGSVSVGIARVGSDGRLELSGSFGELAPLEEESTAIECEVCALAAYRDTAEVGGYLALGYCTRSVALVDEDGCQCDVWTWLVGL
jgi:hypothetical protein